MKIVSANALHAAAMADILNDLIDEGGTTALAEKVSGQDLKKRMSEQSRAAWHVAESDLGDVLGFQWIEPADYLPFDAAEIATFAKIGHAGLGIGSALFDVTRKAAVRLGYSWINANIRADNKGGLAYYQSRGFEDYDTKPGVRMSNGLIVDKVLKRFDL